MRTNSNQVEQLINQEGNMFTCRRFVVCTIRVTSTAHEIRNFIIEPSLLPAEVPVEVTLPPATRRFFMTWNLIEVSPLLNIRNIQGANILVGWYLTQVAISFPIPQESQKPVIISHNNFVMLHFFFQVFQFLWNFVLKVGIFSF